MNYSWLEKLEQDLEKKFEQFLLTNPHQELLLKRQDFHDRFKKLEVQRQQIQQQAHCQRQDLISLANNLRQWKNRAKKARQSGETALASKAEKHISDLLDQGKILWSKLEKLGIRFNAIEKQISALSHQAKESCSTLEEDWARFEATQELEKLKMKNKDLRG